MISGLDEDDVSDLEAVTNEEITFADKKENEGEKPFELDDWKNWENADWWIAGTTWLGTLWWLLWGWFVYAPTTGETNSIVPIAWMWGNTGNATLGYTAIG